MSVLSTRTWAVHLVGEGVHGRDGAGHPLAKGPPLVLPEGPVQLVEEGQVGGHGAHQGKRVQDCGEQLMGEGPKLPWNSIGSEGAQPRRKKEV